MWCQSREGQKKKSTGYEGKRFFGVRICLLTNTNFGTACPRFNNRSPGKIVKGGGKALLGYDAYFKEKDGGILGELKGERCFRGPPCNTVMDASGIPCRKREGVNTLRRNGNRNGQKRGKFNNLKPDQWVLLKFQEPQTAEVTYEGPLINPKRGGIPGPNPRKRRWKSKTSTCKKDNTTADMTTYVSEA